MVDGGSDEQKIVRYKRIDLFADHIVRAAFEKVVKFKFLVHVPRETAVLRIPCVLAFKIEPFAMNLFHVL